MLKSYIFFLLFIVMCKSAFAQSGVRAGDNAPLLSVDEWLKGDPVKEFLNDNVYLIEFWGTWCGPCIENIPHLSEIQKKYSSDGLIVIGVATHEFKGKEKLIPFMQERGDEMKYRVAYDSDLSMEHDWDTGETGGDNFRLPVCFVVDRTGKITFVGHPGDKKLEAAIEDALRD